MLPLGGIDIGVGALSNSSNQALPVASPVAAGIVSKTSPDYRYLAVLSIALVTVVRLLWLAVQPADLYPDEAQYWFWAQTPALGYYSKPPLVAWVIALTTGILGDSEFAIRIAAPLLHAG